MPTTEPDTNRQPTHDDHAAGRARSATAPAAAVVPIDVLLVMEMLARHRAPALNRRQLTRCRYVMVAQVEFAGEPGRRRTIYTRDANERGVGFVTPEPLPAGRDATLRILAPDGTELELRCALVWLEKVLPGWYEGAFQLETDEPRLAPPAPTT